jgi:surfactin synthase thioesterase subunit
MRLAPGDVLPRLWLRSAAARATLFCLPHAGGSASEYRAWPAAFPPTIDVQPVQLPGREALVALPPETSAATLVPRLGDVIAAAADRPFALFGHSMGAALAAELAAWLEGRCSLTASLLVVSARASGPGPHPGDPADRRVRDSRRPAPAQDDALVRNVLALGGTSPMVFVEPELRELALRVLRADYRLCETYQPTFDRLRVPVLAVGGREDRAVPAAALQSWSGPASAGCRVVTFPGGHFYHRAALAALAEVIVQELGFELTVRAGAGGR